MPNTFCKYIKKIITKSESITEPHTNTSYLEAHTISSIKADNLTFKIVYSIRLSDTNIILTSCPEIATVSYVVLVLIALSTDPKQY